MLRDLDLGVLNSATQYPSIPTYHQLDPQGGVLLPRPMAFPPIGKVIVTEKVDGTNARLILLPSGEWVIGSRTDLLTSSGDIVYNQSQGIVEELRSLAGRLEPLHDGLTVLFLEVYGGKNVTQASRQYTSKGGFGHRLFDVALIPVKALSWPRPRVAAWRDNGGQPFATHTAATSFAEAHEIPQVPDLTQLRGADLPTGLEETCAWLGELLPRTLVALDDKAGGAPEGVVVRTENRSVIGKARFQDYGRTFRKLAEAARGR